MMSKKNKEIPRIMRNSNLLKTIKKYPQAIDVLQAFGLHCIGCAVSAYEDIESGAKVHGLSDDEIDEMISEINSVISQLSKDE